MKVYIIEHREQWLGYQQTDTTVAHVSSTFDKAVKWCTEEGPGYDWKDHEVLGDLEDGAIVRWWWFVITEDTVDGNIGSIKAVYDWDGDLLKNQPVDGYEGYKIK